MSNQEEKLLNFLKQQGILNDSRIAEIEGILKKTSGRELREVLIKGGFIDGENLAQAEAEFYNYPYVNLLQQKVDEAAGVLPRMLVEQHFAFCFSREGQRLKIALAKPDDYGAREAIDFWISSKGYNAEYFVCSWPAWQEMKRKTSGFGAEVATAVAREKEKREEKIEEEEMSTENIEDIVKSAPVAQIVSMVIKHAIENKASDIHIEPYEKSARVRFRVDGILQTVLSLPDYIHDAVIARIKVLADLKIDETRVPQDGRIKFETKSQAYDLRVSIMPLAGKEKVTMRILDVSAKALKLEQLGFSDLAQKLVANALKQTYGMVLVTGPTGSGKSTTLFSILSQINKEGVNITTLEDPIEYNVPGINQAQIRPEVKFTFASGLRALMRQDPDIIMVGEIRDSETAEMAVHAALTGHLLFSTLHTNDAAGSIPRLIDMKVEPFLLASTLNLVIAQRLCRRICAKCKETAALPSETAGKIRKELSKIAKENLPKNIELNGELVGYRGKGCPMCKDSGYSGRLVIAEVLPISEKMRQIIADGFPAPAVAKELESAGMVTLLQDGILKSLQGLTSLEEVFRVSKEVEEQ